MLNPARSKEVTKMAIGNTHQIARDSATRAMSSGAHALPLVDKHLDVVELAGMGLLRYGLVFLLSLYGSFKFFSFEAEAIQPLVANSPFLGWLYPILGVQGTSSLFGVFEVTAAVLIATRPWLPRVSGYASLAASLTFVTTLSFLFTTPGVLDPMSPIFGFLVKDVFLLGAALVTSAEALGHAAGRTS
jgi:reactive chlorine resistance protein C